VAVLALPEKKTKFSCNLYYTNQHVSKVPNRRLSSLNTLLIKAIHDYIIHYRCRLLPISLSPPSYPSSRPMPRQIGSLLQEEATGYLVLRYSNEEILSATIIKMITWVKAWETYAFTTAAATAAVAPGPPG